VQWGVGQVSPKNPLCAGGKGLLRDADGGYLAKRRRRLCLSKTRVINRQGDRVGLQLHREVKHRFALRELTRHGLAQKVVEGRLRNIVRHVHLGGGRILDRTAAQQVRRRASVANQQRVCELLH